MLSADRRLCRPAEFSAVLKRGRRAGRPLLTCHLDTAGGSRPAMAGLVVSKAVGGSVTRHAVARRLRHLLFTRLPALPDGTRLVVRAAPPSAAASSAQLGVDLDRALARVAPPGAASTPRSNGPDRAE